MKALLLVAAAAAIIAPMAGAAAWNGPAPAALAAQFAPSVNKIVSTCPVPGCVISGFRFGRATCARGAAWNTYNCTAPLMRAGFVQTEGTLQRPDTGAWLVRVTGTASNWRVVIVTKCVYDDCGGILLAPVTRD